jgi:hypothetical protein
VCLEWRADRDVLAQTGPDEYQGADSKDVVRLVMGLVVTTVALALGLLVGSAKSFYDTQNAEMAQLAANYIMLDRVLEFYGPEAADARAELRTVPINALALTDSIGESKSHLTTVHTKLDCKEEQHPLPQGEGSEESPANLGAMGRPRR